MRSARTTWSARLIAAVTTLALLFAPAFGAQKHAAGHAQHASLHAAQVDHHHAPTKVGHIHVGDEHETQQKSDAGKGHADCDGTMCHAYAVLGQGCVIADPVQTVPGIAIAVSSVDAKPGSLERPPKSPALA